MEITDVNTIYGAYPLKHRVSTADSLVSVIKGQGVNWCLTLSTSGVFASDMEGNVDTITACRAHDQLIPVATLNPCVYLGNTELITQITSAPFEMFRFFPHIQEWPIDFAPFADILTMLGSRSPMPIMISVREPGDATALARITKEYRAPVIMEGVNSRTLGEAISVMRRNDQLFLETHAIQVPDALPLLRDAIGISRILFGSATPGSSLSAALRYVKKSALSDEDRNAVLGGNAQAIWHGGEG